MSRIFAIGDIHGCSRTFSKLLGKLEITKRDKVYCLGDYIDRGPNSKGVVDLILKLRKQGFKIHTIRGNHECLMMDSFKGEKQFNTWMHDGGDPTLSSFKIESYNELNLKYRLFFTKTKYYIVKGNFHFSHAGFNFQNSNIFEDKTAMLWSRNCSVEKETLKDRIIIHGHSPRELNLIEKSLNQQIINIDAGCVFKKYGFLVALNLTENKLTAVKNIDM